MSLNSEKIVVQLTGTEVSGVQNLFGLSYSTGDILYYDGADLINLGIGTEDQLLAVSAGGIPEWVDAGAVSGATVALDNLAGVAINTSLISDTTNTDDLGSASILWANLFVTNIGATGTRVTQGWFTDLTVTNAINADITGNAATATSATSATNASTATALQTARTIGGVSFDGTANITVATATGGFTISGGNLALGTNSLTMTGSIAATGSRVTKGWFTDIESTNMPTVGGTAILTSLTAPQFTTIELGHATDTTLSRVSAGVIAIEGVNIVTTSSTDTLTNKTLTAPVISTISNTGTLTLPTSTDTLVGRATTDTLTNKTLTSPVISTISNTGTLTLPTSTDTLVGRATTDTLTNKRVTPRVGSTTSSATPTIDTDSYDDFSITALATAITSMTTNLSGTPTNFQKLIIRIKDDGTARAITWGASFEAKGVALPTTTVISKVLTVGFIYDSVTSKWGCVASAQEA